MVGTEFFEESDPHYWYLLMTLIGEAPTLLVFAEQAREHIAASTEVKLP